uniref:Solute carrier family 25 member 28 n=1 Tax=Bubo bubo TaxID=30461 RepID=A0A8C0F1Y0_BUBBB
SVTKLQALGGRLASLVKQRMQMYNSPYQRVTDCVRAVWRNEGAGAFYRSYTTQLTMNIPFQAIHFMTYEFLQEQLNPHRQYNPGSHVVSGACAGAVAAAATTPLDVCKTLLNTQESLALSSNISGHITGMANAFRTVYQVGGVTAYFRGVQARVIYQMPSTFCSILTAPSYSRMVQLPAPGTREMGSGSGSGRRGPAWPGHPGSMQGGG